jgi:hypothetical protein
VDTIKAALNLAVNISMLCDVETEVYTQGRLYRHLPEERGLVWYLTPECFARRTREIVLFRAPDLLQMSRCNSISIHRTAHANGTRSRKCHGEKVIHALFQQAMCNKEMDEAERGWNAVQLRGWLVELKYDPRAGSTVPT